MSDIPADPSAEAVEAPPTPSGDGPVLTLAPPAPPVPAAEAGKGTALAVRLWSGFIFAISSGMLGIGRWLTPDPTGLGTHHQLGLPPCGFFHATGIPCPTCGCTTVVAQFAHGHLIQSLLVQPFGFAVGAVAVIAAPTALVGLATGRWLGPSPFWMSWHWRWWVFGGGLILLAAWIYKIIVVAGAPG